MLAQDLFGQQGVTIGYSNFSICVELFVQNCQFVWSYLSRVCEAQTEFPREKKKRKGV